MERELKELRYRFTPAYTAVATAAPVITPAAMTRRESAELFMANQSDAVLVGTRQAQARLGRAQDVVSTCPRSPAGQSASGDAALLLLYGRSGRELLTSALLHKVARLG